MKLIVATILCSVMASPAKSQSNLTYDNTTTNETDSYRYPSIDCYGGWMPDGIAKFECPYLNKCMIKRIGGKHAFKMCGMSCPKEAEFVSGDYKCEFVNGWQRCCCEGPLCNQARQTKATLIIVLVTFFSVLLYSCDKTVYCVFY